MSSLISDLEPITKGMCEEFLKRCHSGGIFVRVTHTYRSNDEQLHLFQKGREFINGKWEIVEPLLIVTNAMPGQSAHNYRAAFDICFSQGNPYPKDNEAWLKVGIIGTNVGLNWGGDYGDKDRFKWDRPHFERPDWKTLRT